MVFIGACPRLTTLRALTKLATVRESIAIRENERLPTCEAEWLASHVASIGGDVDIGGNNDAGVCQ